MRRRRFRRLAVVSVALVLTTITTSQVQAHSAGAAAGTSAHRAKVGALAVQGRAPAAAASDVTITFDEYPDGTAIADQYEPDGIVFGGDSPFITTDSANPTSPVLSGTPRFQGAIVGTFVTPAGQPRTVDGFTVDVGYIDTPGAVSVTAFDSAGQAIDTESITQLGIVSVAVSQPAIASFQVSSNGNEDAGFAIDNLTFAAQTAVEYSALGDSFSSGEGVPPFISGTNTATDKCHRATHAYDSFLAGYSSLDIVKADLKFVACSGATRQDVWIGGFQTEQSQFTAVSAATNLITISVGGNDVNFSTVLQDCITGPGANGSSDCANLKVKDPDTHKTITLDQYEQKLITALGTDSPLLCETPDGFVTCAPALHNMYAFLAGAAAAGVRIRVLLYPHLFTNSPAKNGCTLKFFSPVAERISKANMVFINRGVDQLDAKIKAEVALVAATGIDIKAVDPRPAFNSSSTPGGHGVCTKDPWINGLILNGLHPSPYSFHPNLVGQATFARRIKGSL